MDDLIVGGRTLVMAQPLLVLLALAAAAACFRVAPGLSFVLRRRVGLLLAIALAALFVGLGAYSVARASYDDHIEPAVVATGAMAQRGHPAYSTSDSGPLYGLPYGPLLFGIFGAWAELAGAGATSIKALALAASIASGLVLAHVVGWRRMLPWPLLLLALLYTVFLPTSVWARAEPFLLLLVSLSATALGMTTVPAAVVLGGTIGLAMSLKITAIVYLVPFVAMAMPRTGRARFIALVVSVTLIVCALPFVLGELTVPAYVSTLRISAGSGIRVGAVWTQAQWALVIMTVAVCAPMLHRNDTRVSRPGVTATVVACLALTAVVASKHGAGAYHFLPFAPFLAFRLAADSGQGALRPALTMVLVVLLCAATFQVAYSFRFGMPSGDQRAEHEAQRLMARYGQSTAVGYGAHLRDSFARPVLVAAGGPYPFDVVTLTERQAAGIVFPEVLIQAVLHCEVDAWLLPAGQPPFAVLNGYDPSRHVFPDAFRDAFRSSYELSEAGSLFDVWQCIPDR